MIFLIMCKQTWLAIWNSPTRIRKSLKGISFANILSYFLSPIVKTVLWYYLIPKIKTGASIFISNLVRKANNLSNYFFSCKNWTLIASLTSHFISSLPFVLPGLSVPIKEEPLPDPALMASESAALVSNHGCKARPFWLGLTKK